MAKQRLWVETLVTQRDPYGQPIGVGWKTDGKYTRYGAARRWSELTRNNVVVRLVDSRGEQVVMTAAGI